MGGELWRRQIQNGVILDFDLTFDLEDPDRSLHKQ